MIFERLLEQLQIAEGYRQHPYKDILGRWTLGFGNTYIQGRKVTHNTPPVSFAAAQEMLMADAYAACIDAQELFANFNQLDDVRQEVLVDMAFNLGGTGLARFVKMRAAVEQDDFEVAAAEMKDSRWYDQVGIRAKRLVKMMKTGKHPQ